MTIFDFNCESASFSVRLAKVDEISSLWDKQFFYVVNGVERQAEGYNVGDPRKFEKEYQRFRKEWREWIDSHPD